MGRMGGWRMTVEEIVLRSLFAAMDVALHFLGATVVRDHAAHKVDEWELARLPREAAFRGKFGEEP